MSIHSIKIVSKTCQKYFELLNSIFVGCVGLVGKQVFDDKRFIHPKDFVLYHRQVLILDAFKA